MGDIELTDDSYTHVFHSNCQLGRILFTPQENKNTDFGKKISGSSIDIGSRSCIHRSLNYDCSLDLLMAAITFATFGCDC